MRGLEEAATLGSGLGRGLMELGLLVMNTLRLERGVIFQRALAESAGEAVCRYIRKAATVHRTLVQRGSQQALLSSEHTSLRTGRSLGAPSGTIRFVCRSLCEMIA
jgi:hypothetical protein